MKQYIVEVTSIEKVTHNVLKITTKKSEQYAFTPGQATEVSINKSGWKSKKRPFTFTCLLVDDYLEFTIKTYATHKGVTNQLLKLKKGDTLILHDVFGAICYKGEGVFIAGGAGVTPFISIFRYLKSRNEIENNRLIFVNKTKVDIILEKEFKKILSNNFINILSNEKVHGYDKGQITEEFIKAHCGGIDKMFYVCGPPPMVEAIEKQLAKLHVPKKAIVKEAF